MQVRTRTVVILGMTTLTLVGVATIFGPNVMAVLAPGPGGASPGDSPMVVGGPAGGPSGHLAGASAAPGAPGAAAQPGKDPPRSTMLRSASTDGGS